MKKYVLLYSEKKPEDNLCLLNMFENNQKINLGWVEIDYNKNMKIIKEKIDKGIEQLIFAGIEVGWTKMIKDIKKQYPKVAIKVICTTQDSLLYYEYERNNFFDMLQLSKNNIIDDIAFMRKGQYETYKSLGYKCSYLMENYILDSKHAEKEKRQDDKTINLGIYPLNYTWDKNIFNQLCIAKFIDNCKLNYYNFNPRMEEFLNTMNISNNPEKLEEVNEENIIKSVKRNDVIVSASFTEYMHPIFWIGMELGIPVLVGNTLDLFNGEELEKYVVTKAEDNAIINSKMVLKILKNKDKINQMYKEWKQDYNNKAKENLNTFLNK